MTPLPDTVYLVRRRDPVRAGDQDWFLVNPIEAQAYMESPHWEVEERDRPAGLPAESKISADVEEFIRAIDGVIGETPAIRSPELIANLIGEEAREALGAILGLEVQFVVDASTPSESGQSLVAAIDGLCDLLFNIFAAFLAFGIHPMVFWPEIHRSNMDKVGGRRRPNGTLVKPEGWRPPEIARLLIEFYGEEAIVG